MIIAGRNEEEAKGPKKYCNLYRNNTEIITIITEKEKCMLKKRPDMPN